MPLIGTAIIYFVLIKILTVALAKYEEHLRKSEIRQWEEEAMIKVNNLKKSFNGVKVLTGITEEIHEGEVVVVIGWSHR